MNLDHLKRHARRRTREERAWNIGFKLPGEDPAELPQLKALLVPYPSEDMICWPVSTRVGNVKNNDPRLIEPIAGAG